MASASVTPRSSPSAASDHVAMLEEVSREAYDLQDHGINHHGSDRPEDQRNPREGAKNAPALGPLGIAIHPVGVLIGVLPPASRNGCQRSVWRIEA